MKISICLVMHSTFLLVMSFGEFEMIGKGRWQLHNFLQCDNPDQYDFIFDASRQKLNRTHDSLNVHVNLDRELNETYGIYIIAYKKMDGGFKFFYKINDSCACCFIEKYTGENMERALIMAKVDPPKCPISPGELAIDNFVVDYRDFPDEGMYGTFDATIFVTYDGQNITCTRVLASFDRLSENDDDNDY